jgi:hypothetical protein
VHIYRPRSARITAVGIATVATLIAVATVLGDGPRAASPTVGACLLLAIAGVVAYWRPCVGIGPDAVVVNNVVRRATIPFARLVYVDTKWSLELYLDDDTKVTAFAAPAPGAFAARTMRSEDARGLPRDTYVAGTVRPGDRRGTPSGDAAALVRAAWERSRTARTRAASGQVSRSVDVPAVIALAVGGAAAITGFLL